MRAHDCHNAGVRAGLQELTNLPSVPWHAKHLSKPFAKSHWVGLECSLQLLCGAWCVT